MKIYIKSKTKDGKKALKSFVEDVTVKNKLKFLLMVKRLNIRFNLSVTSKRPYTIFWGQTQLESFELTAIKPHQQEEYINREKAGIYKLLNRYGVNSDNVEVVIL